MKIITNKKVNFNSLEENTFKKMMELGRDLIRDELKLIDKLIKQYKDIFRRFNNRKNGKINAKGII